MPARFINIISKRMRRRLDEARLWLAQKVSDVVWQISGFGIYRVLNASSSGCVVQRVKSEAAMKGSSRCRSHLLCVARMADVDAAVAQHEARSTMLHETQAAGKAR